MPRRKKAGNEARMGEENAAPKADIDQKIKKFEYDLVQTSLFPEYSDGEASVSEAVKKEKEKKKKAEKLAAAEGMLDEILGDDKKGWVNVYRLLKAVQDYQLYTATDCSSFSAWLRKYAKRCNVSTQTLWRYQKCGRYFEELEKAAKKKGKQLDIDPAKLSSSGMALIARLARNDPQKGARLAKDLVDGRLPQSQLSQMWRAQRAEMESRGEKAVMANGYEAKKFASSCSEPADKEDKIKAADIVRALQDATWLPGRVDPKDRPPYVREQYLCLTEFPVRAQTTTRHLDALIVENCTVESEDANFRLWLHGIEIKVSEGDLKSDKKMEEYAEFVDRMWIAISDDSPELWTAAEERIRENPGWGLLMIDHDGTINVIIPADGEAMKATDDRAGVFRETTLMTVIHKLHLT